MNKETDHEEFLTPEDFGGEVVTKGDLEKINGHPIGENVERIDLLEDDEPIGLTPTGLPLYRSDDPGEMYKVNQISKPEKKQNSLLEQTPEKQRYFLQPGTLVEGRSEKFNIYRSGFCIDEAIVKRVKDEKGKWLVKKGLNKYQALTKVNFFFESREDGKKIHLSFESGETFYAAKTGEDKEKRKMMLKKIK